MAARRRARSRGKAAARAQRRRPLLVTAGAFLLIAATALLGALLAGALWIQPQSRDDSVTVRLVLIAVLGGAPLAWGAVTTMRRSLSGQALAVALTAYAGLIGFLAVLIGAYANAHGGPWELVAWLGVGVCAVCALGVVGVAYLRVLFAE